MSTTTLLSALRGKHARNAQNAHIMNKWARVGACLDALVREGYTVLRIEVESAEPVLWVQACAHCEKLPGAWYRMESAPAGRTYTWQAHVLGCRVQWLTRADRAGG